MTASMGFTDKISHLNEGIVYCGFNTYPFVSVTLTFPPHISSNANDHVADRKCTDNN